LMLKAYAALIKLAAAFWAIARKIARDFGRAAALRPRTPTESSQTRQLIEF
jgi:hypothetical protein